MTYLRESFCSEIPDLVVSNRWISTFGAGMSMCDRKGFNTDAMRGSKIWRPNHNVGQGHHEMPPYEEQTQSPQLAKCCQSETSLILPPWDILNYCFLCLAPFSCFVLFFWLTKKNVFRVRTLITRHRVFATLAC